MKFSLLMMVYLLCAIGAPLAKAADKHVLGLGFYLPALREANLADIKISLQTWADELGRPMGYQIRSATYDDINILKADVKSGVIDLVNAGGMELAENFSPEEFQGGYARRTPGVQEGLLLVVNKASAVRSFADLRGKRVAFLSKDRLHEVFLETQCLKAASLSCKDFLLLSGEKRDIQSTYSVFFGKADAALISRTTLQTAIELNPQVGQRLRVVTEWNVGSLVFGMLTRNVKPDLRDKIIELATQSMRTERGRQLLEIFKTDSVQKVETTALYPYWELLAEYQALSKARGSRKK